MSNVGAAKPNNLEAEARILSFFGLREIPRYISDYLAEKDNGEIVLGMDHCIASRFMQIGMSDSIGFSPLALNRAEDEYYSTGVQAVAAACIHDDTTVLMLRLNQDSRTDGYRKGTLTYPQGHCTHTREVLKRAIITDGKRILKLTPFMDILRDNAYREVSEELKTVDDYAGYSFWSEVSDKIRYAHPQRDVFPVYIDKPGSLSSHIGFIFDVTFQGNILREKYAPVITSREPDKHEVVLVDMNGLLQSVDRADQICPWVAYSFSKIPFYRTTFIASYKKNVPFQLAKAVDC